MTKAQRRENMNTAFFGGGGGGGAMSTSAPTSGAAPTSIPTPAPASPPCPPVPADGGDTAPSYKIRELPLGSSKYVRVVCIGAGASGINLVHELRRRLVNVDVAVYEKNADVGGTWLENRYPGCRCDVPSHSYQFSWLPNHGWSNFFAPAEEIGEYMRRVCDEAGIRHLIKTSHQLSSARWDEQAGVWELVIQNLLTGEEVRDRTHFLVDGTGILNKWRWPDVPGLNDFQGTLIHTARWPKDFDPTDKVIAVIGNGSSGVQVLPELQKEATRIYHPVRTPSWVVPPHIQAWKALGKMQGLLETIGLDQDENFSQETIDRFKSDPEFYRDFVRTVEVDANNNFPVILKDSPVQAYARTKVTEYMTAMLGGDEKLCEALIPSAPLGFKRMTPGHAYLRALTKPNVEVFAGGIKRFTAKGIELETGETLEVDAVVCATGFDTSFVPRYSLVGRNGNLQDTWQKETPEAYLSCAVAGLPNFFMLLGPNGPVAHGSVLSAGEQVARYVAGVIGKCQTEAIKAIAPAQAAVDDYSAHVSALMPRTAWAASGRSWFKARGRASGPVTALHPGSRLHFFRALERFRGEDFQYVYDDDAAGNRFAYLGNGLAATDLDPAADKAWYLHL